jgi:glycosidase
MIYSDIHADSSTMKNVSEGWFVDAMPDLNQKNPFVSKYIIQNTIWWIEFSGLDGIREDTYPYIDQKFAAEFCKTILNEYPDLNIVGEVWTGNSSFLADFQAGNKFDYSPETYLLSVTDFDLRDSYFAYISGKGGLYNIYETFAEDFLYEDPYKLVTFIDNHDLARGMFYADGDIEKFKTAYTLLLTTRGIPQLLYATEIGMIGGEDHGSLRADFPGGFPGDSNNSFSSEYRTEDENEIFNYIKKLLELRKKHSELSCGRLVHFPPERGVYIFFKILDNEISMVVVNDRDTNFELRLNRYQTYLNNVNSIENLMTGEQNSLSDHDSIEIKSKSVSILKLNK